MVFVICAFLVPVYRDWRIAFPLKGFIQLKTFLIVDILKPLNTDDSLNIITRMASIYEWLCLTRLYKNMNPVLRSIFSVCLHLHCINVPVTGPVLGSEVILDCKGNDGGDTVPWNVQICIRYLLIPDEYSVFSWHDSRQNDD